MYILFSCGMFIILSSCYFLNKCINNAMFSVFHFFLSNFYLSVGIIKVIVSFIPSSVIHSRSPFCCCGLPTMCSSKLFLFQIVCAANRRQKYVKKNKGNAKRGVSPRLKIRPCDLDLWPWKSIGFQILLRSKYAPSLVKIH